MAAAIVFMPGMATMMARTVPRRSAVSLAAIEQDIRNGVESAATWLKQTAEEHLPAFKAELEKIAASPVAQALEAAVLTPAEESMIARIISDLPALRSQPAPDTAESTPDESQATAA